MKPIITFLLLCSFSLISPRVFANEPVDVAIGYVYQKRDLNYILSMKEDNFKPAILLAISDFNKSTFAQKKNITVHLKEYAANNKTIDLQRTYLRAVNDGVIAILGIPTSKEALLVGKLAQESKVLTFSMSGSHNKIGQFGEYLYSGSGSLSSNNKIILSKIFNNRKPKNVLVITDQNDPFSSGFADRVLKSLETLPNNYQMLHVAKKAVFSQEQIDSITSTNYDFIIISIYTYNGVRLLNELTNSKIITNQPIIVPGAWYYDNSALKHIKNSPNLYSITTLSTSWIDKNASLFTKRINKSLHRSTKPNDILAYDITQMILKSLPKASTINREQIKNAFLQIKGTYKGIAGPYFYDNCNGHPRKNIFLLKLTDNFSFKTIHSSISVKDSSCTQ